jgi:hypothetical protein
MSEERTSRNIITLRQSPGILLHLRHEADVDENSHRYFAGYISKVENNKGIDDN